MVYEANRATSCLVEMDEEPPGELNPEALDVCFTFALITGGRPVDEVHVMRKIVVDGSNTTGFQRTCVTSLGGSVEVGDRSYGLTQICLEEDAARKIAEEGVVSRYRIDRLGIPLIEVTTAPDIHSPEEAEEVALAVGRILRATGKVRRGLGTIRQDVNVSIEGGALIEIKGVQELALVSKVVEYEVQRQTALLEIASELKKRRVSESDIGKELVDASEVFRETKSRIIKNALREGGSVHALKLKGFGGLVGRELCPNRRLGTEMADYAKFWGGVKGIFHTDELPAYDISEGEVKKLKAKVGASKSDAVVIVADEAEKCSRALMAVADRAREALIGVPQDTRAADPNGTTHFTRPRPGAARMYPETDVVSIVVTPERIESLKANLPEMPEEKLDRFKADYGINEKLARQVIDSDHTRLFEELAREGEVDPTLLSVTLTETLKMLEREGMETGKLSDDALRGVFSLVGSGRTAKESIPEVLTWLGSNPEGTPEDALLQLGLVMLIRDELRSLVEAKVAEKRELVERMGARAVGPLMGVIMADLRGRAEAREVQALLRELLEAQIED